MKKSRIAIALAVTTMLVAVAPTYAAEGAATGNGTSTPAGPAADNQGPTKSGGASSMSSGNGSKKMKKKHHHHHHHHKGM